MDRRELDESLTWRLANRDGAALEPLMERWGDAIVDTCFRALRDSERALDLYGEVWAEVYVRIRLGTEPVPHSFGSWAVGIIGEVLWAAAEESRIPIRARLLMKLSATPPTSAELAPLENLRNPDRLRAARDELPRDFSAAADRMLLDMPEPTALRRVKIPAGWGAA